MFRLFFLVIFSVIAATTLSAQSGSIVSASTSVNIVTPVGIGFDQTRAKDITPTERPARSSKYFMESGKKKWKLYEMVSAPAFKISSADFIYDLKIKYTEATIKEQPVLVYSVTAHFN